MRTCHPWLIPAFAAACCLAADQPPSTQSTVDLSSPKSAVISVYKALRAGDVPAASQCIMFADAAQAEAFDLAMTPTWHPLALMHAMEARFGGTARQLFSAASLEKAADRAIEEVNQCKVDFEGDTASLSDAKSSVDPSKETLVSGIQLKKQGEQWKIAASTFPEMPGEIPPQQLPVMRAMRQGVVTASTSIAARVARGEFKTAEEAYQAYQVALQQASKKQEAKSK